MIQKPDYFTELKRLAPSVVFSVSFHPDPYCKWDGNPEDDPSDEGFSPYDTDFTVNVIVEGELEETSTFLGGSWYKPGETVDKGGFDWDAGGYAIQQFQEAIKEMQQLYMPPPLDAQLEAAAAFLKEEGQRRYDAQRKALDHSPHLGTI